MQETFCLAVSPKIMPNGGAKFCCRLRAISFGVIRFAHEPFGVLAERNVRFKGSAINACRFFSLKGFV